MAHTYQEGDEPVPGFGYRLVEFLGRGGFGEVWKATAPGGAEAALKIIPLGDMGGRKEFRALQLVKRSRHANLVPIIALWLKSEDGSILDDALTERGELPGDTPADSITQTMQVSDRFPGEEAVRADELIIAMGLGDKSLFDRLKECRAEGRDGIPLDELLRYMEGAARAIDFLNSPIHDLGQGSALGIQHCDIKPQNLMIVGGVTQICDFGLAQMIGADRTTTAAATIAYAAPECLVHGKPSDATDQCSLAISYFELRTGRLPYKEETLAAVMDAKRHGKMDFSPLAEAEQAVLRRATTYEPSQRFETTSAMVEALRAATAQRPEAAAPGPADALDAAYRETAVYVPPSRRVARFVALGLIVLATAAAGVGIWWTQHREPAGGESTSDAPGVIDGTAVPVENGSAVSELITPGPPPEPAPSEVEPRERLAELLTRAGEAAARGDWKQALAAYSEAVELQPADGKARLGRGRCYRELKRFDEAISDFQQLDSGQYDTHKELAETYLARGTQMLEAADYDTAIADFDLAAGLDPSDARVFSRRGAARFQQQQWDEAVAGFTAAIKLDPNDTDYVSRGRAYVELGQTDEAIADFREAVRLNPRNAAACVGLGATCMERGETDQAVVHFGEAIRACSEDPEAGFPPAKAHILRGAAYMILDPPRYDEAAADFDEALRRGDEQDLSQTHALFALLADGFAEGGQRDEAVRWIESAIQQAPDEQTRQDYRDKLEEYQRDRQ